MKAPPLIDSMDFMMNVKGDIMLKFGKFLLNVLIVYQWLRWLMIIYFVFMEG